VALFVVWDKSTDVSERSAAFIIGVEELIMEAKIPEYMALRYSQKTAIFWKAVFWISNTSFIIIIIIIIIIIMF
jgi:hypothetical protein